MVQKAFMVDDVLYCSCGTGNYNSGWISDLVDNLSGDGSIEDKETYECSNCDRKYEVTLGVSVTIDVNTVSLEEITKTTYVDKDGNKIPGDFFESLIIGSEVPSLVDGDYEHDGMIIRVEEGAVQSRFNNEPHPDQMNLFD